MERGIGTKHSVEHSGGAADTPCSRADERRQAINDAVKSQVTRQRAACSLATASSHAVQPQPPPAVLPAPGAASPAAADRPSAELSPPEQLCTPHPWHAGRLHAAPGHAPAAAPIAAAAPPELPPVGRQQRPACAAHLQAACRQSCHTALTGTYMHPHKAGKSIRDAGSRSASVPGCSQLSKRARLQSAQHMLPAVLGPAARCVGRAWQPCLGEMHAAATGPAPATAPAPS